MLQAQDLAKMRWWAKSDFARVTRTLLQEFWKTFPLMLLWDRSGQSICW